jgi:hypothetical protein
MKKIILTITVGFCITLLVQAQNLITKVPIKSSLVIKYAGENFSKNVPIQKMDSYNFIKNNFFKMLHLDSVKSIQNLGIDFEKDMYQYVTMEDSSINFVTMMQLSNVPQFLQLVKTTYGKNKKIEQKGSYQIMALSKDTYVGWNETTATIIYTNYQSNKSYYDYKYNTESSVDTAIATTDSASTAVLAPAEDKIVFTPPVIVTDEEIQRVEVYEGKKETTKGKKPTPKKKGTTVTKKKTSAKKPMVKKHVMDEATIEEISSAGNYNKSVEDSIEDAKRDLWYQQQEMYAKIKQSATAEKILNATFIAAGNSIENDISYKKIIDPTAHISVWLNYESILKQYWGYIFKGWYSILHYNQPTITADSTEGFKSAVNMYFDKDKMRMEQKAFAPDEATAKMGLAVMNSKQNVAIANYVNPGALGHFSMSINTEAMANYYYSILKKSISAMPYMNEYGEVVNAYIDLLEIMIDEKGIADLMPGNFLFVMHDAKTKQVTYTDYDYDKEYNRKEVTKTKTELSPNFTFVMETRKEGFFKKIVDLPVKFAKKEKFNYQNKGGYYELAFSKDKYPISSLYFIVKDGRAIVTTSKEVVDNTLANIGFATDEATKKSILNNNYSLKLNASKIIEMMTAEFNTDVNKKVSNYLLQNMGDVTMESAVKDGIIQGTTIMNIKGNHSNSLEFFFNMIDAINNIIETDKQEKDKKVD